MSRASCPSCHAERVALLEKTLPPLPIMPIDLFSRGTDMRWDCFLLTCGPTTTSSTTPRSWT